MSKLFLIIALLCCCTRAFSLSVLGSHLEWQTVPGSKGLYKVRLTLYLDATSAELEQQQQYIYLFHNDRHWEKVGRWLYFGLFYLERVSSRGLEQDTLACAGTGPWDDFEGQRHVFVNIYEKTIGLPGLPMLSPDNGFIVAWHGLGQRDGKDSNFSNSSFMYEWVTTFIPPETSNGAAIRNSSPVIGNVNTFFVCKDELATIQLSATDHDGDNLKYRLSKPYGVYSSKELFEDILSVADMTWGPGYNDQNQMHRNPSLGIDESTGLITVKPSEEGQYFIGISVEEYRNGKKIGTVSFYYTLTVVNCNERQAWDKDIYKDSTSVQTLTICEGSEVTLASRQTFPGAQPEFQWTKNGKVIWEANAQSIVVAEEGEYQLSTSGIAGCPTSFKSEIVHVNVISSGAKMDSIPPLCNVAGAPIQLRAVPTGGTFAGVGVSGNSFDPYIAGAGTHEIEYTLDGSGACPTSVARREVVVSEVPALELKDVLYASRNKPVSIGVKDSLDLEYKWMPPTYLNDETYANPISTPAANITYTVTAANEYGCTASREVKIKIVEHILVPDAFTPNEDGINETWELKGIEGYPNCHVTIYNRWGEVIFNSIGYKVPFDGMAAGAVQMPGVYAYKIRLTENSPELTGPVTLIR